MQRRLLAGPATLALILGALALPLAAAQAGRGVQAHLATSPPLGGINVVSECRCMLDNNAMESEILPIEELMDSAKPDSPRPGRYGDMD